MGPKKLKCADLAEEKHTMSSFSQFRQECFE